MQEETIAFRSLLLFILCLQFLLFCFCLYPSNARFISFHECSLSPILIEARRMDERKTETSKSQIKGWRTETEKKRIQRQVKEGKRMNESERRENKESVFLNQNDDHGLLMSFASPSRCLLLSDLSRSSGSFFPPSFSCCFFLQSNGRERGIRNNEKRQQEWRNDWSRKQERDEKEERYLLPFRISIEKWFSLVAAVGWRGGKANRMASRMRMEIK